MARQHRSRPKTLEAVVAAWLESYESAHTRVAYAADLDHFGNWANAKDVDLLALTHEDVDRYRAACEADGAGASTVARRLSAIASFGAFAHERGTGPAMPRFTRPALPATTTTQLLSDGDASAILAAADQMNPRSAVLIRLLMLDGLKVTEAVKADATDVKGKPPDVILTLHTRLPRVIELHPETARLLATYLGNRRHGPLLWSEHRARNAEPLTRFGVDYIVKQAAAAAGIAGPVSANTLRRRFITNAHNNGQDLDGIRADAGHADARTTRRYLRPENGDNEDPKTRRA
jgi:site-specific recombinase XerD